MLAALVLYVAVVAAQTQFRNSDWPVFMIEAKLIRTNPGELYDRSAQAATQLQLLGPGGYRQAGQPAGLLGLIDPPWVSMLAVPFAAFGLGTGGLLWSLAQLATLLLGLALMARDRTDALYAAATIPTWVLLGNANMVGFVVLGLGLSWRLAERRPWLAGVALGLAMVRPNYLLPLPFAIVLARNWRLLGGAVAAAAALVLISSLPDHTLFLKWMAAAYANGGRIGADLSPAGIGWILGDHLGWALALVGLAAGLVISRARGPALLPACLLAAPHALIQALVLVPAGLAAARRCRALELLLLNGGAIVLILASRSPLVEALLGSALLILFAFLLRRVSDGLQYPAASLNPAP